MFKKFGATQRILSHGGSVFASLLLLAPNASIFAAESATTSMPIEAVEQPSLTKPYQLGMTFKSGMAQYSTLSDERTAGLLRVETSFRYKIIDELTFKADVHLLLLSQRAQQDLISDAFDEGFRLKQAFAEYKPLNQVTLSAGVINQQRNFAFVPMLMDDRGFPGFAQSFSFEMGEVRTQVFAQEGIPTSRSLNSNRVEKEATPVYLSQGVRMEWNPSNSFRLTTFGLHYSFQNLPSIVAAEGYSHGNTLTSDSTPTSSRFMYAFDGLAFGVSEEWKFLPNYSFGLELQTLRNLRAPRAYNSGVFLTADLCFCFSKVEVRPAFISFFNESDTSPAVYNDGRFGHNNREGNGGQLKFVFPKWKFSAVGRYISADVINETANGQTRSEFVEIYLEANYENLL